NPEITIEANPDDLTSNFLRDLSHTAVNRLSIGIQSLIDRDLILLNRRHNSAKAIKSIEDARKNGFDNISIDLIYGIPGMNNHEWLTTLNAIPEVEHISAYHLTIEPGTALFRRVSSGLLSIPAEDISTGQFYMLREFADKRRMIHYEISNLAKEGFLSKHNTAYWKRNKYLGAGPSAHSYDMRSRQWNVRDVKQYIDFLQKGEPFFEREELSERDHFNEYIMVSLRTMWGADERFILEEFGEPFYSGMAEAVKPYMESGHMILENGIYKMTASGWLISDHILARLISG
ncbi:MAG TPA: radical SAM protein, partial [Bacteroidales bacterium]|nr:radical SAM protein [Bacteroidales bacterium]